MTIDLRSLTPELLGKYDKAGPRYTSYPTAPHFLSGFGADSYAERLAEASQRDDEPLSMYVHLPFCEERCTYCGCNIVVSPRHGPEERYLESVEAELDMLATALGHRRRLNQLHWGGGTPTYLSPAQCKRLFAAISSHFQITDDAEVALEIDPCVTTERHLQVLRELGFNRVSMGVQDFKLEVQQAVKRIQPLELTRSTVVEARRLGFESVNIDLIYGLPHQTEESYRETVRTAVTELDPDRVACFSYAHVPWIKPHQRQLEEAKIPRGWEKFRLFAGAVEEFLAAGYSFVGFDHFAKPDDELARAMEAGSLHRNFMGYTVMPATDQVGVGVTAIGDVGGAYVANDRKLASYQRRISEGLLPVERGIARTADDDLRGSVIREIICNLQLDFESIERDFEIDPRTVFADALEDLAPLADDDLVELDGNGLRVTGTGRFFLRNICMPFDAYLKQPSEGPVYSRTV